MTAWNQHLTAHLRHDQDEQAEREGQIDEATAYVEATRPEGNDVDIRWMDGNNPDHIERVPAAPVVDGRADRVVNCGLARVAVGPRRTMVSLKEPTDKGWPMAINMDGSGVDLHLTTRAARDLRDALVAALGEAPHA